MLYIEFINVFNSKDIRNRYITNISDVFNAEYRDEWLLSDKVKEYIRNIDHCDLVDGRFIVNDVIGSLPVTCLSSGTKSLIFALNTSLKISGDRMGDNCYPYLFDIAEKKDIYICLSHPIPYRDGLRGKVINYDLDISTENEFWEAYIRNKEECDATKYYKLQI